MNRSNTGEKLGARLSSDDFRRLPGVQRYLAVAASEKVVGAVGFNGSEVLGCSNDVACAKNQAPLLA